MGPPLGVPWMLDVGFLRPWMLDVGFSRPWMLDVIDVGIAGYWGIGAVVEG